MPEAPTTQPLRWGVLGSSARIYRSALKAAFEEAGHSVVAEASMSADGPDAYRRLLEHGDVDAVYNPLPNHLHTEWTIAALDAGKHVLCEKPLTLSAADTTALFDHAEQRNKVLLEAYMWPHHPAARMLLRLAADGSFGALQSGGAQFSWPMDVSSGDHRLDERGAGVMFDVGIYCIAPFLLMAGRDPVAVWGTAQRNDLGVDTEASGLIDWGEGFSSSFAVSFDAPPNRAMWLVGSEAVIRLPDHAPGSRHDGELALRRRDGAVQPFAVAGANAYAELASHFAAVVSGVAPPVFGRVESERLARIYETLRTC
jgi:D-xylose 1-dehydrogenase (NADP+, D-xylono-1,5-lactone-forming)